MTIRHHVTPKREETIMGITSADIPVVIDVVQVDLAHAYVHGVGREGQRIMSVDFYNGRWHVTTWDGSAELTATSVPEIARKLAKHYQVTGRAEITVETTESRVKGRTLQLPPVAVSVPTGPVTAEERQAARTAPTPRVGDVVHVRADDSHRRDYRVRVAEYRPADWRGQIYIRGTLVNANGSDRKGSPERALFALAYMVTVIAPAPATDAEWAEAEAEDAARTRVATRCACEPSDIGCVHPDCKGVPPVTVATEAQPVAADVPQPAEYGTQSLARVLRNTLDGYPGLACPTMPRVTVKPLGSFQERSVCVAEASVNGHTVHVIMWEDTAHRAVTSVIIDGRMIDADVTGGRGVTELERANMVAWRVADVIRRSVPVMDAPTDQPADQAEAAPVRMAYGTRSAVRDSAPTLPGNGHTRTWSRTINGRPYTFTAVTMPDGERRYFASRYNGYLADADGQPTGNALSFGCAWSQVHAITVPAPGDGGDQGNGSMLGEMHRNARRTAEVTGAAFLERAGALVTVHQVTRWDQRVTGDADAPEISYRPVISSDTGYVSDVEVRGETCTVELTTVGGCAAVYVRLVGSDHPVGTPTPYVIDVHADDFDPSKVTADQADAPAEAAPEAAPVVAEAAPEAAPVDVMAEARTLAHGDHVSGLTADRRPFGGYVCGTPYAGRDRHGNTAVIIRVASAPVDGRGSAVAITGCAQFSRLPVDPRVIAQGEALSAMAALKRAGYTVKAARCAEATEHDPHIYRADDTPARTRLACGGAGMDPVDVVGCPTPVTAPVQAAPTAPVTPVASVAPAAPVKAATEAATAPVQLPASVPPVATVATVEPESEAPMPASEPTTTEAAEAASVPAGRLVATIERATLIEALSHASKAAPSKGVAPEYAAVTVASDGAYAVTVTARGWDAVMTVTLDASVAEAGMVMVNTKELLQLTRKMPAPKGRKALPTMVTLAHQGDKVTVTAGATALVADAVNPTLDLGPLPVVPATAVQTADGAAFTEAVSRVVWAAGTDDTLRNLMGVGVTTSERGDQVTMLATNRYVAADVTLPVTYRLDADTVAREHVMPGLAPAVFLGLVATVAAKCGADTVDMNTFDGAGGYRWFGYRFGRYTFALRAIDGLMPNVRAVYPKVTIGHVTVHAGALAEMLGRVATVATGAPGLVKLTVASDAAGSVTGVTAQLLRTGARESMPASGQCADGFTIGVDHKYLCDALAGVPGDATLSLAGERKPVTVTGESALYRGTVMPVRLSEAEAAPEAAPEDVPVAAPEDVHAPAPATEAAPEDVPEAAPIDVHNADQVTAAGDALVTIHGMNGHREPATVTGRVKGVTECATGRVAGLARVQLDTGRTVYVSVTATPKGPGMTTTTDTVPTTDTRNLPAEKRAGDAFTLATGGDYAGARAAMAEASAMVPTGYRFGNDTFTAEQILAMIDTHETTGAFRAEAAPATAPATEAAPAPATEAAPTGDQGDADMAARVRDALSRVTWQGVSIDGRSADLMVLPSVPRAVYLAIKAVIEPIGGTYERKRGTRPGGFAFAPSALSHRTGRWSLTGREKVAALLAGGEIPADQAEAPAAPATEAAPMAEAVTEAAPMAEAVTEAAPMAEAVTEAAPVQLPSATDVDAAWRAGYAAGLAAVASNAAPAPAPATEAPAEAAPAPAPATEAVTYTLPDYAVSNEAYGASVAAITERLDGHKGVTVKRVARKGFDRRKFTVTGPASAHAVAAAYVKALESGAAVKA